MTHAVVPVDAAARPDHANPTPLDAPTVPPASSLTPVPSDLGPGSAPSPPAPLPLALTIPTSHANPTPLDAPTVPAPSSPAAAPSAALVTHAVVLVDAAARPAFSPSLTTTLGGASPAESVYQEDAGTWVRNQMTTARLAGTTKSPPSEAGASRRSPRLAQAMNELETPHAFPAEETLINSQTDYEVRGM